MTDEINIDRTERIVVVDFERDELVIDPDGYPGHPNCINCKSFQSSMDDRVEFQVLQRIIWSG